MFLTTVIILTLLVLPSMHFMYKQSAKPSIHQKVFLVTITQDAMHDEDFKKITTSYLKHVNKTTVLCSTISILLLLLLLLPDVSDYILPFLAAIFVPVFLCNYLYAKNLNNHRILLINLKDKKNWSKKSSQKIVMADLTISKLKNLKTPKSFLFAIPIALSIGIFMYFKEKSSFDILTLLLVSNLAVHILCYLVHRYIAHSPAKIYTQNREIDLKINHEYRRRWSVSYLVASFTQVIMMYLILSTHVSAIETGEFNDFVFYSFFLVAFVPVAILFYSRHKIQQSVDGLLQSFQIQSVDDEDAYYEYHPILGFLYHNPNNPSIFVNKEFGMGGHRFSQGGMGLALNTGNPKGKALYRIGVIIAIIAIGALLRLLVYEDFITPVMSVSDNEIKIERTIYPFSIKSEQIEGITLVQDVFPRKGIYKNVGTATSRILRGTFAQKGEKNVQLYLFPKIKSYIRFTLKDMDKTKLYFNYDNDKQTAALYEKLKVKYPEKVQISGDIIENSAHYHNSDNLKAENKIQNNKTDNLKEVAKPNKPEDSKHSNKIIKLNQMREEILKSEINYSLPAGEGNLHVVLNLPKTSKNAYPLAIIIPGSGPSTKDGMANIYLDLAGHLVKSDIACIRYDKRGIAGSKSVFDIVKNEEKVVFQDFVEDVILILKKAKADKQFSKIYLIGHSEGSLISILAIQNEEIDGFISIAGAGRNIADITSEQIKSNPMNPKEITEASENILQELKSGQRVEKIHPLLNALFRPSVQPYLISWMKLSPTQEIEKLNCDILILQGDNDSQVSITDAENLYHALKPKQEQQTENIQNTDRDQYLDKNQKTNKNQIIKLAIIPDMTHMFKESKIRKESMYEEMTNLQEYLKVYQDDQISISEYLIKEILQFIAK